MSPLPDRFIIALGLGIFTIWAISCIAEIVSGGAYKTPLALHGMMGTIVGAVFTEARMRRQRRKQQEEDSDA